MKQVVQFSAFALVGLSVLSAFFGVMLPVAVGCGIVAALACTALYVWLEREEKGS